MLVTVSLADVLPLRLLNGRIATLFTFKTSGEETMTLLDGTAQDATKKKKTDRPKSLPPHFKFLDNPFLSFANLKDFPCRTASPESFHSALGKSYPVAGPSSL